MVIVLFFLVSLPFYSKGLYLGMLQYKLGHTEATITVTIITIAHYAFTFKGIIGSTNNKFTFESEKLGLLYYNTELWS